MTNEIYIETAIKIINLELNSRKDITRPEFIKKMTTSDALDFIASESTVWRYLTGNKDAGKRQNDFINASLLILGIPLVEMYEMVDIYLTMDEETITVEKYKREVREAVFVYSRLMYNYRTHIEYREDRIALNKFLDENTFDVLNLLTGIKDTDQNAIILLYNNFSGFTSRMQSFWEIAINKSRYETEYILKIKEKSDAVKVRIEKIKMNQDLRILFNIKMNQKTFQDGENDLLIYLKDLKGLSYNYDVENCNDKDKHVCRINSKWLFCVVHYYKYNEESKIEFLDTAFKYSFLSESKIKDLMSE